MTGKSKATYPYYFPMGDQAIVAQFEEAIAIEISQSVQSFLHVIEKHELPGITNLLPAFNNLTICYDPTKIRYDELLLTLSNLEKEISNEQGGIGKKIHVPITFDKKYGQDLDFIAESTNLSTEEVIETIHSKEYFVHMIGFVAGYPYAGNIDERLILKRRKNPRAAVKKGTVQIVDKQIGIMTIEAPTGWHQIGWTPMEMFNAYNSNPSLLGPGNYVKYVPISLEEAEAWDAARQKEWDREWN